MHRVDFAKVIVQSVTVMIPFSLGYMPLISHLLSPKIVLDWLVQFG